jgi:DnaJ family protein B protein 4
MVETPEHFYERIMMAPQDEQAAPDGTDLNGGMFADSIKGQNEVEREDPKDIEITLECTLKEFYCGSMREIAFERQEIHHVPKTSTPFKRSKQIEVKPGYSESTVLVFKGEGTAAYNKKTSDLVIRFKQIEHPQIQRSGDNLVQHLLVPLEDALALKPVTF